MLSRALTVWLETGSVLVVAAPRGAGKSAVIAAWLGTRAERMVWVEGSEHRDGLVGLDVALEGLYETGVLTRAERLAFTGMRDLNHAFLRESSPVLMILNNSHLVTDVPALEVLVKRARHWPGARFVLLTDEPVDPNLLLTGLTVFGAQDLRDPLHSLSDRSRTTTRSELEVVEDWARLRDSSGGLFRLLQHLARHFSVPQETLGAGYVEDAHGTITELLASRVVELVTAPDGQRISLVPEFRAALTVPQPASLESTSETFHLAAARDCAEIGYEEGVIFHLARAGRHPEALEALAALRIRGLNERARLNSVRSAAAAIDLRDPAHGIRSLAKRLQIALIPPLESATERTQIQEALWFAQDRAASPVPSDLDIELTIAHVVGLLASGRSEEARLLGRPLADSLFARKWLDLVHLGATPARVWAAQATAELLEGRFRDAAQFARVAQEAANKVNLPYVLYIALGAVAAVEAINGELSAAERSLAAAQRIYRQGGWSRTVSQTSEFVARFYLARASLDVVAMSDLRQDIAVIPDATESLLVLMRACECFVFLHSGQATQTRVGIRQLAAMIGDPRLGAVFRGLAVETVFEAQLRLGAPQAAIDTVEAAQTMDPDIRCMRPLLAAAALQLLDANRVLALTEVCVGVSSPHTPPGHALVLLLRAAAYELLGSTATADACFQESLLMQGSSPMPILFLVVPPDIRQRLWYRVAEQRQWLEMRRFLGTIPEGLGVPDIDLPPAHLTSREMEILRALCTDGTLEEIALSHYLSRNTIKSHVRIIYKKLRVNNRSDAAKVMKRFGGQLVGDEADTSMSV